MHLTKHQHGILNDTKAYLHSEKIRVVSFNTHLLEVMMKIGLVSIIGVACLSASFAANAGNAAQGDFAVVVCSVGHLVTTAFSHSYSESDVDPNAECSKVLKALQAESMYLVNSSPNASNSSIIYTFHFEQH
jgi:hypothetical protein